MYYKPKVPDNFGEGAVPDRLMELKEMEMELEIGLEMEIGNGEIAKATEQ